MSRVVTLLLIFHSISNVYAIILKGKVVTKGSLTPVPTARIYVLDSNIGGVPIDYGGEFTLKLSEDYLGKTATLLISSYYYESLIFPVHVNRKNLQLAPIELLHYEREPDFMRLPVLLITGRILDNWGIPLGDVEVFAANTTGHTYSEKDGSFRLYVDQIREIDETQLWLHKPGYRSKLLQIKTLKDRDYSFKFEEPISLDNLLDSPVDLTLLFRDSKGLPLPKVEVSLETKLLGISDQQGVFEIELFNNLNHAIRLKFNYSASKVDTLFVASGEKNILVNRPFEVVDITLDTQPVKLVVIVGDSTGGAVGNAEVNYNNWIQKTNLQGRAEFPLARHVGIVQVQADEYLPKEIEFDSVQTDHEIRVILSRIPPSLRRLVMTALDSISRNPLIGVRISLSNSVDSLKQVIVTQFTDARGLALFVTTLVNGKVSAELKDYMIKTLLIDAQNDTLNLDLVRQSRLIKLRFVDNEEKPLPGVKIRLQEQEQISPLQYKKIFSEAIRSSNENGICMLEYYTLPVSFITAKKGYVSRPVTIDKASEEFVVRLKEDLPKKKKGTKFWNTALGAIFSLFRRLH